MKLPEFRISANDPTLAHVAAYGQIKQLRGNTRKVFDAIRALEGKAAVRKGVEMMKAHFGKLILSEGVVRLKGSRPKATWLALDANVDGGSDMVAIIIEVDSTGWSVHDLAIRLAPHSVARLMQRTTKTSSLQRFAETLRYHILAIMPVASRIEKGYVLKSVSNSGAMIWVPHEVGVRAITWLSVESITDPKLAKMCVEAGTNKIGLDVTKDSPWMMEKPAEAVAGTSLTMRP